MIPIPSGVKVWIATGVTDMRRGMNGLSLQVQEAFGRDPHAGDLYVFRGRRGDLIKVLWHDGLGLSIYAKRLERGRFIWPSAAAGDPITGRRRSCSFAMHPLRRRERNCYWSDHMNRERARRRRRAHGRGGEECC